MQTTEFEEMVMEGARSLSEVLSEMADKLYEFADTIGPSDEEIEEIERLNAGKTDEEIAEEDELAAQIAAPLVNALDGLTSIINDATLKVVKMTSQSSETGKQPEEA